MDGPKLKLAGELAKRYMFDRVQLLLNRLTAGALPAPACALPPLTPPADSAVGPPRSGYRVLLVHAHPCVTDSFSASLADAAHAGLEAAGHTVQRYSVYDWPAGSNRVLQPALSREEKLAYHGGSGSGGYPSPSADVAPFVADLKACDALVCVYPTWWFSLPAALKGLIDRTFLPGVAFTLPTAPPPSGNFAAVRRAASTGLVPGLINIKKVGVVTTYGAPRHIALAAGDGGNALFGRALLPLFHQDCAIAWAGLYDMHNTTHEARAGFIARVRDEYQHAFLPEAKR